MRKSDLFPNVFQDVDGCLANFDKKALEVFGMPPRQAVDEYGSKYFWTTIKDYREDGKGFFESLELMPDAMVLWNGIKHLNPVLLTGAPHGDWAEPQKRKWGEKHFPGVEMIVCLSKDKRDHMNTGDIIIDDTVKYRHLWEEAGGVFIVHTSAQDSIKQLKKIEPMFFQKTDMWNPPKQ